MTSDTIFICPVCRNPLRPAEKKMICMDNHNYDLSREGYVNLLLPQMKKSRIPGDSPDMIRSRNRFLSAGHYSPLPEMISFKVEEYLHLKKTPGCNILDAGCGEGYILSILENRLKDQGINFYGLDISREAVKTAAKRNRRLSCAVAGLFSMPVADGSVNILINTFAPSPGPEFRRVLKPGGIVIHVHPGEEHLHTLREKLFDQIVPLRKDDKLADSFTLYSTDELKYSFNITGNDNICDLINMTPYSWKTGKERITRFLEKNETLQTTAHFVV